MPAKNALKKSNDILSNCANYKNVYLYQPEELFFLLFYYYTLIVKCHATNNTILYSIQNNWR